MSSTVQKQPFWWRRFEVTKERREWTPRRLIAAERAVRREADAVALFPELRRVNSVAQRMEQMDARSDRITARLRQGRAEMWRDARRFLRSLPTEDRERLLARWNTRFMPGGPADLLSLARLMGMSPPDTLPRDPTHPSPAQGGAPMK